jgi:hypothetical protein
MHVVSDFSQVPVASFVIFLPDFVGIFPGRQTSPFQHVKVVGGYARKKVGGLRGHLRFILLLFLDLQLLVFWDVEMRPSGNGPLVDSTPSHDVPVPRHNQHNVEAVQADHGGRLPYVEVAVSQK